MYKKICPFCKKDSYSASQGKWICPYCNNDLSIILPEPLGWEMNINKKNDKDEQHNSKVVYISDKYKKKK